MGKSNFSDEFKRLAVARVLAGESPPQVAAEIGVSANSVRKWVQAADMVGHERTPTAEELVEMRRLRKRIADLEESNTILKKATALFAKDSK